MADASTFQKWMLNIVAALVILAVPSTLSILWSLHSDIGSLTTSLAVVQFQTRTLIDDVKAIKKLGDSPTREEFTALFEQVIDNKVTLRIQSQEPQP